jgi:hypothetical protein
MKKISKPNWKRWEMNWQWRKNLKKRRVQFQGSTTPEPPANGLVTLKA